MHKSQHIGILDKDLSINFQKYTAYLKENKKIKKKIPTNKNK